MMSYSFLFQMHEYRYAWENIVRSRFSFAEAHRVPRTDRLHMLELELQTMRSHYAVALRYRNAAVAACSLPPEVLAAIFSFAQDSWSPNYWFANATSYHGPDAPLRYFLGWMTVTHVCTQWRQVSDITSRARSRSNPDNIPIILQVALNSPHLWQNLDCIHLDPRRATDYLLLSGCLPLHLKLSEADLPYQATKDTPVVAGNWITKSTLQRTERLDVNFKQHRFEQWASCLELPAPALKRLSITIKSTNDRPSLLSRNIFASRCPPLLTHLHLEGCYSSWRSPLFSANLTHLRLGASDFTSFKEHLPTINQLQDLISYMPVLQELQLDGTLPRKGRGETETMHLSPPFKKMHITLLSHDTFERYANFWSHFTFDPTTVVAADIWIDEFAYAYSDDEEEDHEDVITSFGPLFDNAPPPFELAIADEYVTVRYNPLPPLDEWIVNVRGDMKRGYERREDPIHGSRHLFAHANFLLYVEYWPLQDLHTIVLCSETMAQFKDMTMWTTRFAHARAVRRIAVPYLDSLQLLYALTETQTNTVHVITFALFPCLEEVVLVGDKDEAKMAALHAPLDVSLLDVLHTRRERGAPISQLVVDGAMWAWDIWSRVAAAGTPVRYLS